MSQTTLSFLYSIWKWKKKGFFKDGCGRLVGELASWRMDELEWASSWMKLASSEKGELELAFYGMGELGLASWEMDVCMELALEMVSCSMVCGDEETWISPLALLLHS